MKKLFIDDERFPVGDGWDIVRSSHEAIEYVISLGRIPEYISFDHDLGGIDTAREFLRWLTDQLMDGVYVFPPTFDFYVHSQNPIGAKYIRDTIQWLLQHFPPETITD